MSHAPHRYFDARPSSVGLARRFVRDTLTAWGVTGDLAEDVRLCVSELASNALLHGTRRGHGFLVRLSAEGDFVRLEVHDSRDAYAPGRHPCPRQVTDADTGGRGLHIVRSLADEWGVEPRAPYGKIVWSCFKMSPGIRLHRTE